MVLGAVVLMLGARLVQLQGLQPAAYAERAGVQRTQEVGLAAQRGDVRDRNATPRAVSVFAKNVYAEPRLLHQDSCRAAAAGTCDPRTIAAKIAPLLGLDTQDVEDKLSSDHWFVYLKRGVDTTLAQRVLDLGLPGIGAESTSRRVHPSNDLASGVLGFTNLEGDGKMGVTRTCRPCRRAS